VTPRRTVGDDPDGRVAVKAHSDLAAAKRGLTTRQVDRIAQAFGSGDEDCALVIEAWCDDKDLSQAEGVRHVYFGEVVRESDAAWRFATGGKVAWLPKSVTTVFENALDGRAIESPQRGLADFASGGSG
jgi:hypothetical protein